MCMLHLSPKFNKKNVRKEKYCLIIVQCHSAARAVCSSQPNLCLYRVYFRGGGGVCSMYSALKYCTVYVSTNKS